MEMEMVRMEIMEMVMEALVEVMIWGMVVLVEERKGAAGGGGERRMYVDAVWIRFQLIIS